MNFDGCISETCRFQVVTKRRAIGVVQVFRQSISKIL